MPNFLPGAQPESGAGWPAQFTESLLRLLVQHLPVVIWTTDRELRFTSSFGGGLAGLGLSPGEAIGWSLSDYCQTGEAGFLPIAAHRRALLGEPVAYEFQWKDRVFQVALEPLPGPDGEAGGVLGLALDVTERDRAERARIASEQQCRQLAEDGLDVIFTLDLNGNVTSVNKAAQRVSGYTSSELVGGPIARLLEPGPARLMEGRIQRALGGETTAEFELPIVAKDGRRVFLEVRARLQFVNGQPAGILGIARDVSERKRLEEQLRQTQKMEAVGNLAGGVAHDFNNLLSAILGYTDLLKAQSRPGELVREAAEVIEKAGERAQQLANRLLGFARPGKSQNIPVDLHSLLGEVVELLERTMPKNITVAKRFDAGLAATMGDPGQLHQVFLNLALNARDAMPEGGLLTFQTELVELNAETIPLLGAGAPGPHIKILVSDTGMGIAPEHMPRVFEPFFTTKENCGGTGMGLAVVYGIVKNHRGGVEVTSQPGRGATFTVYLPLALSASLPQASRPAQTLPQGTSSILVIDDEAIVGQAAVRLLESLGYRAVAAADPREALEVFRNSSQMFDLVILDLLMPGLNGQDCFRALRAIRPELPVIVTSGYSREDAVRQLLEAGAAAFLPKPYQLRQLADAVQRALGA